MGISKRLAELYPPQSLVVVLPVFALSLGIAAQAPTPAKEHRNSDDYMRHRFDPAQSASSLDIPKRDAWQRPDQVLEVLKLRVGMTLADIGAGTGYFTIRLARHSSSPRVFAVDIEQKMLDHLRIRVEQEGLKSVTTVLASEASPNLPTPVDLVIFVNTYHHIPNRIPYFTALRKSLKTGGRVAIIDWKQGAPMGPQAHYRFSPDQIRTEMGGAAFQLAAQHDFLPYQNFLIFQ